MCQVANYLFPKCKVIGGDDEALNFLQQYGSEFGLGPTKRLPVSGAFHTRRMDPAIEKVAEALSQTRFARPLISVYGNLDASIYPSNAKQIQKRLLKQLYKPVCWESILHQIYDRVAGDRFPNTYEVGPGSQLSTMLKRTNAKASQNCKRVQC